MVGYALEQLFTVTLFFHRGQLAASHRKRKSVQACDLKLGQTLSDESAVLKSLQETQEQMAAEANHSETIAHQRKRKMIREARKSQEAKGASGEIARAKSGVNSPNVHMGLVASNIDAIWGVRVNLRRAAVKKK